MMCGLIGCLVLIGLILASVTDGHSSENSDDPFHLRLNHDGLTKMFGFFQPEDSIPTESDIPQMNMFRKYQYGNANGFVFDIYAVEEPADNDINEPTEASNLSTQKDLDLALVRFFSSMRRKEGAPFLEDDYRDLARLIQSALDYRNFSRAKFRLDEDETAVKNSNDDFSTSQNELIDEPPVVSGHIFIQGGAGEGKQVLGPNGNFKNSQVVKTDSEMSEYCNPPNPCPKGFKSKDGCIEEFVNTAAFSREYQAKQDCACDVEHSLFECPTNSMSADDMLTTLARSIQNRWDNINLDDFRNKIFKLVHTSAQEKLAKFCNDDASCPFVVFNSGIKNQTHMNGIQKNGDTLIKNEDKKKHTKNPFLSSERLPIVAKKAPKVFDRYQ